MLPLTVVKNWMKITVDTFDDEIQELMDRAQAIIERNTLWYFGPPRDAEEILDGTGTTKMFLRQYPVDPDEVVVYARSGATDDWTVVLLDDYEIEGRGLYIPSHWAKGLRNFRVVYREGFAEPPGDVAQLFLELLSSRWRDRGERVDMQSETIGDYSYTRADLEKQVSWSIVKNNWGRKRV